MKLRWISCFAPQVELPKNHDDALRKRQFEHRKPAACVEDKMLKLEKKAGCDDEKIDTHPSSSSGSLIDLANLDKLEAPRRWDTEKPLTREAFRSEFVEWAATK